MKNPFHVWYVLYSILYEVENVEILRNLREETIKIQNPKDKTITRTKETQMTGQH